MPRIFYRILILVALLGCLTGLFHARWSCAAEYRFNPSLDLQETYDDNVQLRGASDFEHLISPALEGGILTELSKFEVKSAWDISKYQRHDELDTVDQRYGVSAASALEPWLELRFSGDYVDDYTFASALEESGILAERSRRKTAVLQPGATFALDLRNSLAVDYEFTKTQYALEGYSDYEINGLTLTLGHELGNERTRLLVLLGGSDATFKRTGDDVEQNTIRAMAGVDHRFSEKLQAVVTAGLRFTHSEFPRTELVEVLPGLFALQTRSAEDDDTGFVMDGSLNWRTERTTLSASISRDIAPSIYGENTTRDRARLSGSYRLAEKVRANLGTGYYRTETDGLVQREERDTYDLRPSLQYSLTEDMVLRGGYGYTWTENKVTDNREERNRVFIELSLAWPQQY